MVANNYGKTIGGRPAKRLRLVPTLFPGANFVLPLWEQGKAWESIREDIREGIEEGIRKGMEGRIRRGIARGMRRAMQEEILREIKSVSTIQMTGTVTRKVRR